MNYFKLASRYITKSTTHITKLFFDAIDREDYELIWNELITENSIQFLSTVLYPSQLYEKADFDSLFRPIAGLETGVNLADGFVLAFQLDIGGIRSGFLKSFTDKIGKSGRDVDPLKNALTFAHNNDVISFLSGRMPFVPLQKDSDGEYRIDVQFMIVFAAAIPPLVPFEVATRAFEQGYINTALTYFEIAADYSKVLQRIRVMLWENPLSSKFITEERKMQLREHENQAVLARDKVLRLLATHIVASPLDTAQVLSEIFNHYTDIASCELSEQEYDILLGLNDAELRRRVALTLRGFSKVLVERESSKPHGPAEIADMELPIAIQGEQYYLCLPFKSGREIRTDTVPVNVAYQIIRPFIHFPKALVVFVTAKPCSTHLDQYIKVAQATQGWSIGVIQGKELAKLLKLNKLL